LSERARNRRRSALIRNKSLCIFLLVYLVFLKRGVIRMIERIGEDFLPTTMQFPLYSLIFIVPVTPALGFINDRLHKFHLGREPVSVIDELRIARDRESLKCITSRSHGDGLHPRCAAWRIVPPGVSYTPRDFIPLAVLHQVQPCRIQEHRLPGSHTQAGLPVTFSSIDPHGVAVSKSISSTRSIRAPFQVKRKDKTYPQEALPGISRTPPRN